MAEQKQTFSPAEWKSVSDYLIELSERVQQATNRTVSEPREERLKSSEPRKD
jgi:hypothetical protein